MSKEMVARNDEIDNAVYALILTLTKKTEEELPWDMEMIGEITDVVTDTLFTDFEQKVWRPTVVEDQE